MKKLLLLAAVLVVAVLLAKLWRSAARSEGDATDSKLVQDRLWIDHMPKNDRDTIQVFLALTEQPVGGFQAASAWKGSYELFRYELSGGELRAVYPQTGAKEKMHVRAQRCQEGGMDFCLELDGSSHGVKRYYSREGWEIGSLADEARLVKSIEPAAAPAAR